MREHLFETELWLPTSRPGVPLLRARAEPRNEALEKSSKVGIAKVVIETRKHLATVKLLGKALVLELMQIFMCYANW